MISLLLACRPEPSTDSAESAHSGIEGPLRAVHKEGSANADGLDKFDVKVEDGETAFQVTLTGAKDHFPVFDSLEDPDGNVILLASDLRFANENITFSWAPQHRSTAFNWPIRKEDGPLTPGKWKVGWRVLADNFTPDSGAKTTYDVAFKSDDDLKAASIAVRIVYTKGLDKDRDITRAIEKAVEHWREIWADEGITLVERYDTSDLPTDLSFYSTGSADAKAMTEGKEVGELQLVVGEEIDGDPYLFGVSAGIPGTIEVTENTYVVLSWLTHAGRDGVFDDDEIDLMGETMAHETGHYAGLFHPVEIYYGSYDALDDTPQCSSYGSCKSELGDNLMFPYPVCTLSSCTPQTRITDDQGRVLHQFVGAL